MDASIYWAASKTFYASDAWAHLRAECKSRDHYTCKKCGAVARTRYERSRLHAHHLIPRPPVSYLTALDVLSNLSTRCSDCHATEHAHMPTKKTPNSPPKLFRAKRMRRF